MWALRPLPELRCLLQIALASVCAGPGSALCCLDAAGCGEAERLRRPNGWMVGADIRLVHENVAQVCPEVAGGCGGGWHL